MVNSEKVADVAFRCIEKHFLLYKLKSNMLYGIIYVA